MSQAGISSGGSLPGVVSTLTGNSGGAVPPDGSNNINVLGDNTQGINIVGNPGTSTLTVSGIDSTTTQKGVVALATNAETIAGTVTTKAVTPDDLKAKLGTQTAHSIALFQGDSSALTPLGVATNGQIPIGSTGADPVLATPTSSNSTITITGGAGTLNFITNGSLVGNTITGNNGGAISPVAGNWNILGTGAISTTGAGNTLTISSSGSVPWTEVTNATQTIAVNNGYITNRGGGVTYTLPASAVLGNTIRISGKSGAWTIAQNAGQQINVASSSSTVGAGGSIASTDAGDCVELLCTTAGASTVWRAISFVGNLTVT